MTNPRNIRSVLTPTGGRFPIRSGRAFHRLLIPLILAGLTFLAGESRAGSLYVANYNGDEVLRIDNGSTNPVSWASGVSAPSGLAFDASGNLYVANYDAGTISRIAAGSTNPVTWASGLKGPFGLAFDASGNLYVANYDAGTISRIAAGSTNPVTWASGFNRPSGLAFDPSGNLFIANLGYSSIPSTISRIAAGSTNPVTWASGLKGPLGMAFDASGNLFVANFDSGTISRIAAGSTNPVTWASGLGDSLGTKGPLGIVFDAGNLFVASGNPFAANSASGTIFRIAAGSTNPVTWASGLNAPLFMAYLRQPIPLTTGPAVFVGQQAAITITETGISRYQWKKDGVILPNATNSGITFDSVSLSDSGSYTCDVTGTNGTFTSFPSILTVTVQNYSNQNLSSQDLSNYDFTGAIFTGANLTGADLRNSYFNGADLTGATLTGVKLSGASFDTKTKWPSGFDYLHAGMYGPAVDYSGRNLSSQDLSGYDFTGANFTGAVLTNSLLSSDTLVNANFTGANLQGSDFGGADLTGATLTGVKLGGASFDTKTKWPTGFDYLHAGMYGPAVDYSGQNLGSQDLSGYDFTGANFTGTILTNALFSNALLVNANLTGADLRNVLFDGANLRGANLVNADLRGANLSKALIGNATLRSIIYDPTTKWPSGFTPPPSMKEQTIMFQAPPSPLTFGGKQIALKAVSSAKLPVTFFSADNNVAIISGNTLTITGAGTVSLVASADGNATYRAASNAYQTLVVNPAAQKLTFPKLPKVIFGTTNSLPLAASATGGAVTYIPSDTNVATISGNTLTIKGAGTATITAIQPGSRNYLPATPAAQVLTVNPLSQVLTFTLPAVVPFAAGTLPLKAVSSAGLTGFTYASSSPDILQINGSQGNILRRGKVTVTVSQPGNSNVLPAKPVSVKITIQ